MIRAIHRYVVLRRFQKMVATFDAQIEAARKAHAPVRPIQKAKAEYVRQRLEGRRA
jgi:hypothetical protein